MAMQTEEMEIYLKIIIVGNGKVGKTSMLTRFAKGVMTDKYKKTIGTDFMEKEISLPDTGQAVGLMLWDTAGQEMYSNLTKNYYRGSGAVVYVFSTIDHESFEAIHLWRESVTEQCGDIVGVLVQNKVDLMDEAKVTSEEAEALAKELGMKLYRTSVKDNLQVNEVFTHLAQEFVKRGGENVAVDPVTAEAPEKQNSYTLDLRPSTQRTGGKKSFCTVL